MDEKDFNKDFIKNLAAISHEIQTPVNIIASTARLVDYRLELQKLDNDALKGYMESISNNCNKVAMIVSNIMEVNLSTVSKKEFVNSRHFFDTFSKTVKPYCKDMGVELRCVFKTKKENIHLSVITVERILLNLITNAIKYNDKNNKRITLTMSDDGDKIKFTVTDNGMGIAKEHIALVTKEFFRVNKNVSSGIGLGLTLVKRYLDTMNGSLKINSQLKKGTKISVFIPINPDSDEYSNNESPYEYIPENANFSIEFSQF